MLVIDLGKNANEPQWREYAPGIKALISPWTRTLLARVKAAATLDDVLGVDPDLWNKTLPREIIRDMTGLGDPDGNPVPCTDEVKDLICECEGEFLVWAIEESKKMGKLLRLEGEEALKNSKRSPAGKKIAPPA